jgi:TatD DNase family protein
MLVDTHCHLDQLDDPPAALARAAAQGVGRVVAVSETPDSMLAVLGLKERFPDRVLAGLGLHPVWVVRSDGEARAQALAWLAAHLARADLLGEAGLDYKWAATGPLQALQDEVLEAQFALAARHRKPVNLHSRRCPRQVMERAIAFHRGTGLGAQLHWFTHSRKLVHRCNQEGIYVSVGPTVLDHPPTQEVALAIADELLLLETDAPVRVAGVEGRPAGLGAVAGKLAELKGRSPEEIAALTTANFARYLGSGGGRTDGPPRSRPAS